MATLVRLARRASRASAAMLRALFATGFVAGFATIAVALLVLLWLTADYAPPGALTSDAQKISAGEPAWATAPTCLPDTLASTPIPETAACKKLCKDLKPGEPVGGSSRQTTNPPPDRKKYAGASIKFARFEKLDLSGADFSCATIRDTDFKDSLLDRVDFSCATLEGVRFEGRSMKLATFRSASLLHTELVGIRAYEADFTCARLQDTDLTKSHLNRILLRAARFEGGSIEGGRMVDVVLAHAVFEPAVLPAELTVLHQEDWRTLLPADIRLSAPSAGGMQPSLDGARSFDDAARSLRATLALLEKNRQDESADALRHRIEQLKLMWLAAAAARGNPADLLAYWWRWTVNFVTSAGSEIERIFLLLLSLWCAVTAYFFVRLRRLHHVPNAHHTIARVVAEAEPGRPERLAPLRPSLWRTAPWSMTLAIDAVLAYGLHTAAEKVPLPAAVAGIVAQGGRLRLNGQDRVVRIAADLAGWGLIAFWLAAATLDWFG